MSPNWWNSVKQGWNKSEHIQGDAMEPFQRSGGPQKDPKRAPNGHFVAISGSGGYELAEQCGIKVEQVRTHPGQCNEIVSLVRGAYRGPH